ncbi:MULTISPECIES: hypothetical protein [Thermodesulfovibrio]|jgi:hypothetical protein|uniref:hypothetical protein n=1 Tax=Thermodesulfovibrio TaxID=28261 RepID=UPI00260FA9E3|nr:hypothetical protein [Thermodesulfovibrio sp.]
MEGNRTGHRFKKLSGKIDSRGIALPSALLIGVFALLVLTGIYFALTKLFGSSQTIKTYSSVRDAAAGGVHYAIATRGFDIYNRALNGEISDGHCENFNIQFRLQNATGVFDNNIQICYTGRGEFKTGFAKERVIGSGTAGVFEYWLLFTIISETTGPQGTRSRVEAVYAR